MPFQPCILEGTVQKTLMAVCSEQGIPLLKVPGVPLTEHSTWQGAFITSTTRLVVPVCRMEVLGDVQAGCVDRVFDVPQTPLTERLLQLVQQHLRDSSTEICLS
jgi:branched-subunit amino acid aminotransferase/4-amino-4-deoxychorismate lyase